MRSESQFSTFNLLKCTYINMVYNFMYQWVGKQIEMGGGGLHLSEIVNKQWLCLTLRKIRGGYLSPPSPLPRFRRLCTYSTCIYIYTYINDEVCSVQLIHMYQVMVILYCEILIFKSDFNYPEGKNLTNYQRLLFWIF